MYRCLLLLVTIVMTSVGPVNAFTVEYLAPNASIILEFAEAGYPNPPSTLAGRSVVDYLDAAAPTNPANEWGWSGHVLGYEPGWFTMLYPDQNGSYIYANTTVSSATVAFAGGCDENDGRGEFFVDSQLMARINYFTYPPVHFVLLVDGLADSTHQLQLTSLGGAVALYGGAALGAVPEPSSLLILLCGTSSLGGLMWRRRR